MGRYTAFPSNTFNALQMDAGVLLKNFNIEQAAAGETGFTDDDIVCATTGGINPSCVATYSDFAEDVDNAPVNVKEMKHLDGWECKLSTTSLGTSPELIKLSLGAADIDGVTKIIPRRSLKQTDFSDLWWVGDRADGGFVAIKVINALSTGGFSLQTAKNGKGQITLEITGHVSIDDQDTIPMVFYSIDPALETYTVSFNSNGGSSVDSEQVAEGGKATRPVPPTKAGYLFDNWYSDSELTTLYNFNTAVTADITLYAKWTEAHTVTFDTDGGSEVAVQTVADGGTAIEPEDPTKDGYDFAGWYSDSELTTEYNFSAAVTEDITIYAKWTEA